MASHQLTLRPWFEPSLAEGSVPPGPGAASIRPHAPTNEPLRYLAGTPELRRLKGVLETMQASRVELPLVIGGEEVWTDSTADAVIPHRHRHVLAKVHQAEARHVEAAIHAARSAWQDWHRWPWSERAAVFLRAAELVAGPYRDRLTAATMLDQSKTVLEAEGDAACELADFFRFNVHQMRRLLDEQPLSTPDAWNSMDYRALEGFVYAVTPFNFTAIGGNLPAAPALMGNVAIWKPSAHATLGASIVMELLREAGLPDGVINLVHGDAETITSVVLASPDFAGLHFTGSTDVFREIWETAGRNLTRYRNYPRLVGETGGKDFVVAHVSADPAAVASAVVRASFEYQGQKCSAASRLYIPESLWPEIAERVCEEMRAIRMGDPTDFDTYVGAVIGEHAFDRHRAALEEARSAPDTRILAGGGTDGSEGWFVEPTLIETGDPDSRLLADELFGPLVTAYVYADPEWESTLDLVDRTSPYALTGSVFSNDRPALGRARERLRYAAGNLYVNDKPTGAVVGQQPFGGSRASGTNDKTATQLNLARWVTPLTVKETLLPATTVPHPSRDGG